MVVMPKPDGSLGIGRASSSYCRGYSPVTYALHEDETKKDPICLPDEDMRKRLNRRNTEDRNR